jgi:uncharacterized protein YhaN
VKLRGWIIEGFGHFRDYSVDDIGDGLTVFHGPNEAGKSTLLAFIRGMLFGFPDRRSRDSRYEPIRGGRHGGRLLLDVEGERWTLERDASARSESARVFTPRGEGGEDDLRRALGSADAQLFRSVFAFSLTELQSFATLNDEGARNRIFSAGIVGAGRAARHAINELRERADALYKPRGRNQIIPTLLRELAQRRQATVDARRAARGYKELVSEEESCLDEKQRLEIAVLSARRDCQRYETLISLWPVFSDLHEVQVRIAALASIEDFPAEPERRLAEVSARRVSAQHRLAEAQDELESAERRSAMHLSGLRPELEEIASEVEAHFLSRDVYVDLLRRLQTELAEVAHSAEAVERALRELGDDWNEERLTAFDISLPQRERCRTWGDRLKRTLEEAQSAEREHVAALRAAEQADREVDRATEQLQRAAAPDPARIEAIDLTLRRLRSMLAERRDLEMKLAQTQAIVQERDLSLKLLQSQEEFFPEASPEADPSNEEVSAPSSADSRVIANEEPTHPPFASSMEQADNAYPSIPSAPSAFRDWFGPAIVLLLGVLTAGAVATMRPVLGGIVVIGTLFAAIFLIAWLRSTRAFSESVLKAQHEANTARLTKAELAAAAERRAFLEGLAESQRSANAERLAARERMALAHRQNVARRQTYRANLEEAKRAIERARQAEEIVCLEIFSLDTSINTETTGFGFRERPSPAVLDEMERQLSLQRVELSRAEQLRSVLTEAEIRQAAARGHADTTARSANEARNQSDSAQADWRIWAAAEGIPNEMLPASALDFVPAVQQARELQRQKEKRGVSARSFQEEVRAWEGRTLKLLSRAEITAATALTGSRLLEQLQQLRDQCVANTRRRERLALTAFEVATSRAKLEAAEREGQQREQEWQELLREAGAEDEAHYRSRMQTFADRQRLQREAESLERQLLARLGEGSDAAAMRAVLATGAVGEWERDREHHASDAKMSEQQLEQAIRSHQDAQRRREVLEASADIPRCEAEEQTLRTELTRAVQDWRTVSLARAMTEVTLQDYVRTRQPAVVAQASRMFATVTEGQYPELRQDESGEGLAVVTRRGETLSPEQLSRGTAEQLYLCLRLGLATEFSVHGAQLPLVMDDVCVNFDPERARAVALVLRDYSLQQQVIIFTCHPSTVDMLRDAAPDLRVREMPRYGQPILGD